MNPADDELISLLVSLTEADTAADTGSVLRATAEAACRATRSRCGEAGLCDGEIATSEGRFDTRAGWRPGPYRKRGVMAAPGRVCASATPLVCNDGPCAAGAVMGPDGRPGATRFACVPLPGENGGALGFLHVEGRAEPYGARDVRLLTRLAAFAAGRLRAVACQDRRPDERAVAQADVADRLQRKLLPDRPPRLSGLDVAFSYSSASAGVLSGGDFVDYYSRSPGTLAFAIGDVAGKGVEAMATTFAAKYILRAAVHGGHLSWPTSPGEALQELRTALLEQPDFAADSERFVTVLFGTVNVRRGVLQLASAGHPTPFLVRRSGVERPILLTEPAIGVELGAALTPYPVETIALSPGDLVVMFTDGLVELRDSGGALFEEHVADALAGTHDCPAAEVVERLERAAAGFSARPQRDDLALLCVRLRGPSAVD